ncbi:MAG: Hsp70 family protein [Planctomycetota bacterium]|nr:Hsp70 family protein [Planctomycetota bacterium]
MAITIQDFVQFIVDSGLLTADRLSRFRQGISHEKNKQVESLAKELVKAGLLTKFQLCRIVKGKHHGLVLANNALLEKIGEGGMGKVYRAQHLTMKRIVAVKVLNEDATKDEYVARRFQREVQAAAQLIHPNIVAAFDASEEYGVHFLVMEYVDGVDLQSHVENNGPIAPEKAIDLIIQAAKGLQYAHNKTIIHRDIKPGNLLLGRDGKIKILDMGLARFDKSHGLDNDSADDSLTRDNQIVGTVDFMAPEQADDSKGVDHHCDMYSLGCTFYFLLTGEPPFFRSTLLNTLIAHRADPIPSVRKKVPDVPADVEKILTRMLEKDPVKRIRSMQDLIGKLQKIYDEDEFDLVEDSRDGNDDTMGHDSMELSEGRDSRDMAAVMDRGSDIPVKQIGEKAVGIDLGTTFSAVAYLDDVGKPQTLVNSEGDKVTPSVVLFDDPDVIVGKEAVKALATDMESIAECAKRDLGQMAFRKSFNGKQFPPQVILAYILKKLRLDSEAQIGKINRAVITVPAYFDERRRKATQEAGFLAGIDVLDIINEPTSAAIAYGFQQQFSNGQSVDGRSCKHLLVYDLGGGTFDVTVMELHGGDYIAMATDGDVELGGRDWDQRLVDFAAEQFFNEHGVDPRSEPNSMGRMLRECEDAKRTLSARNKATISVDFEGKSSRIPVTREFFEQITNDLLGRTEFTTRQTLKAANLSWGDVDRILLVGGSTRMAAVSKMLEEVSGIQPERSISPDEAVAYGAAIRAGMKLAKEQGRRTKFKIKNVNSHSLGLVGHNLQTNRKQTAFLIRRNTHLPAVVERVFKTKTDGQDSILIRIVEGESENPDECSQVGKCIVRDLPPNLPAKTPVQVRFEYQEDGRLSVRVKVRDTETEQEIIRENSLTDFQLESWKKRILEEAK